MLLSLPNAKHEHPRGFLIRLHTTRVGPRVLRVHSRRSNLRRGNIMMMFHRPYRLREQAVTGRWLDNERYYLP